MLQWQRVWIVLIGCVFLVEVLDQVLHSQVLQFQNSSNWVHIGLNFFPVLTLLLLWIFMRNQTKELEKSNQRLNSVFKSLGVAIWSHDLRTDMLMITPGIEKLYGYSLEEFYGDNDLWKKVVHPEDLPVLDERFERLGQQESVTSVYRIIRKDGDIRWIQDSGIPTYDEKGTFIDFISVLFDITEQKEGEDQYRGLVEMSPDFIAVIQNWKFDYINESGGRLLGLEEDTESLIGQSILSFVSASDIEEIKDYLFDLDHDHESHKRFELKINQVTGNRLYLEMSVMTILYRGKEARLVIGRDITERKKADETIQYMAYYDALTGLPNRNLFKEQVDEQLLANPDQRLAVLFLDLDRFKVINDTKGHSVGDRLLQLVASRLSGTVKEMGMVSRQGGDEFLILLDNTTNEEIEKTAQSLIQAFTQPFIILEEEFYVTTSVGVSVYPIDGEDQETLIKHADTAMYWAKDQGKNKYKYYNPMLNQLTTRKMMLEAELRKAIKNQEMEVFYQPQYDLRSERIVAVEALLRWNHPTFGMVPPNEFIPLAEETGFILPLGEWVLEQVGEHKRQWKELGVTNLRVAVNVSVRQLQDREFVGIVKNMHKKFQLDQGDVELEITESIMQNIEESSVLLQQLKKLGVVISIDDFGKGYSSLSYLKYLPIDKIKIDKSFVDDIGSREAKYNGSIAKAIIDMGHTMNFEVIAEGIEKEEQKVFLQENHCHIGQGYYFSRPVPEEEIRDLLVHEYKC
ncbi:histidine kinase [Bacillus coahuilensis m2-6]|uniref:sensor domain-containing protein n=1 Tax=Bacillus coahuilensis TaxID=408580 RepID=UPI0007504737|nr:GGDEF domain-containing phosphodiesterase [Bacillus coahuilensis]KUP05421.1 histidine kinase [Bacillus coahuilensis m2-6]